MLLTPLPSPSNLDSPFASCPTHRILVVGGSYAGIACTLSLLDQIDGKPARETLSMPNLTGLHPDGSVEVVLLDERDGFFHTVGAPLAHTSQRHIEPFWKSYSSIPELKHPALKVVQGRLVDIDPNNLVVSYKGSESYKLHRLAYSYLVLATGLSRKWPIVPSSHTRPEYIADATVLVSKLSSSDRAVIIGGGAVGIEIAGELKHIHPTIGVTLVHSRHELLSNEELPSEFKAKALELLRDEGVDVILGQRATQLPPTKTTPHGKERVRLADGTIIAAGVVLNATAHYPPNTSFAPKQALMDGFVDVMPSLMFPTSTPNNIRHFAAGDIANVKGIKRAGGAFVMGFTAAANVWALLCTEQKKVGLKLGEYLGASPMMALAVGEQAVGYNGNDSSGVVFGSELMQKVFGDDLGWATGLRYLRISDGRGK